MTMLKPDVGEIMLYPSWFVDETNNKPDLTFTLEDYGGFVKTSDFGFEWPGLRLWKNGIYGDSILLDDLYSAFSIKYGSSFNWRDVWGFLLITGSYKFLGRSYSIRTDFDLDTDNNGPAGYDGAFECRL
ncbi:MAG: hypothetical protein NC209_03785 [Alistipes sp.]|nr:hypothetical protein [Alistipes sp.]